MNDAQLLRYSRQIMLPQIDIDGQERLLAARALIIGAGGLGSPVAMYLATAGIGHIAIADPDHVELSNLQRQLLHHDNDIGRNKANSAADSLKQLNPEIRVSPIAAALRGEALDEEVRLANIVLDCSDNFATRFAVNHACVKHRTPLVSGAAIRMEGQLAVFDSRAENSPCYHCLYKEGEEDDQTCSSNGVLSPIVGIIGSLQALEAIKLLAAVGENLAGRLIVFDGFTHEWRTLVLKKDPACSICSGNGSG
jgi:adenylyltransferase/sulfurtransferase